MSVWPLLLHAAWALDYQITLRLSQTARQIRRQAFFTGNLQTLSVRLTYNYNRDLEYLYD